MLDLGAYLDRIGVAAAPQADLAGLALVHRAHVAAIPFENLDIQMGREVRLEPEALVAKLVRGRRGGYCFEQNALFALALRALGFEPLLREARVRAGADVVRPRTHMVLSLTCEGAEWLVDVGFGGDGLAEPIRLDGTPAQQEGRSFRVVAQGSLRVLQSVRAGDWGDLYAILPEAVHEIDFVMANWFTSTYPTSSFVQTLTAQRIVRGERHILRNLTHTVARQGVVETRDLPRAQLVPLLREVFGLELPAEARFRALDQDSGQA